VTRTVLLIGALWLAAATALGATGHVARLRPPVPQIILVAITGLLIVLGVSAPRFRVWLLAIDIRPVVAIHLTRLVAGVAFLVLHAHGVLPAGFALPAGWGDILVAVLAVGILFLSPITPGGRRAYLAWNVLGFVDIVMVVINAAVQAMRDPASMQPLIQLPLSLLPTFLVPLIIASHVLLFVRLWPGERRPAGSDND
jgi:hypothetical protein